MCVCVRVPARCSERVQPCDSAVRITSGEVCFSVLCLLKQTIKGWRQTWSNKCYLKWTPLALENVTGERGECLAKSVSTYDDKLGVRKLVNPI